MSTGRPREPKKESSLILICALSLACAAPGLMAQARISTHSVCSKITRDVGTVLHPGSVEYDSSKQTYTVTGSGDNMWFDDRRVPLCLEESFGQRFPDRRHRFH